MSVLVGKKAPSFNAKAVINGTEVVENFTLDQYIGEKYVIFFFYPKDFTTVCPTELHAFQAKLSDFKAKGCEIVACSTDSEESHWAWLHMAKDDGGIQGVTYPVVADTTKTVSMNFGILGGEYVYDEHENMAASGPMIAYRGLFLIDKTGVVRHQVVNDFGLGRSVGEAMRMLDSLIHLETNGEVCPANWEEGKTALKNSHEGVADYLSKN
ncbi:MAG: peroxiredoxin (alkyl hydroperoxide reductase subunit C) [Bacteroidia bacterium]|jgi:peroxiredoxin (alkyl hydroperoxide reductase subunit C)